MNRGLGFCPVGFLNLVLLCFVFKKSLLFRGAFIGLLRKQVSKSEENIVGCMGAWHCSRCMGLLFRMLLAIMHLITPS